MQLISERLFTDDICRPIYLDADGNQYVVDDDGERVFGVWISPDDVNNPLPLYVVRDHG